MGIVKILRLLDGLMLPKLVFCRKDGSDKEDMEKYDAQCL